MVVLDAHRWRLPHTSSSASAGTGIGAAGADTSEDDADLIAKEPATCQGPDHTMDSV